MYVQAIERATKFTRPLNIILRYYNSTEVHPGAATLILLNKDGWVLTCAHVAKLLIDAEAINKKYAEYKKELSESIGHKKEKQILRDLERKYGYSKKSLVELRLRFAGCVDKLSGFEIQAEPAIDIALLKFKGFTHVIADEFPIFPRDTSTLKQGKFLCRLGFPFPEFQNYQYFPQTQTIDWVESGRDKSPQFPIEGMLTRHVANEQGKIVGFELSTPGLKGQSGGPAFDAAGMVWGMQSQTGHLDLDFDVNQEVFREGVRKKVTDSAFLHVGKCVHVDVIKEFLRTHNVQFNEG